MAAPLLTSAPSRLLLVGNPNVGKSVVFGALTGRYATVSNYPGTTVEVTSGKMEGREVVDTPGTNNLLPMSGDEAVTRDIVLEGGTVVQVCDAKNLRRGLLLTAQLAEAGVPMVLVLNMADEARRRGLAVDVDRLSSELGIPVVETVAIAGEGMDRLKAALSSARPARTQVTYGQDIEAALARLIPLLPATALTPRSLGLLVLADETLEIELPGPAREELTRARKALADGGPLRTRLLQARLEVADRLSASTLHQTTRSGGGKFARLVGDAAVHPLWGIPFLAAVLYVCYEFVGVFGAGTAVDFLEHKVFGQWIVPGADAAIRAVIPAGVVQTFLVGAPGVPVTESGGLLVGQYGLLSMALSYGIAIVLPIVATFFVAFSIMEDSGYLPRLAVVANKGMKAMGLNGKAVLPMVLGLGCDTMATMTARIMETKKERIIVTLLLALGVPCSAQLGVILGMLGGLSKLAMLIWAGAVLGTILLVGYLASLVLPGQASDFLLEIPPIRRPQLTNVVIKTLSRIEWYLKEALPLFVIGTAILWVADRVHVLPWVIRAAEPVVTGVLGLPKEAGVAFVIGFLRRDYGAAGLYSMFSDRIHAGTLGVEGQIQLVVAMTVITLFVPCIANFFMIVKERGWKTGLMMTGFIVPFAIGVGGCVNLFMRWAML